MAKTKVKSFVNQFVAYVKGDSEAVQGEKVFRQAESGLKTQISIREGNSVSLEDAVSEAKEGLASARVNGGKEITSRESYVQGLINAQNRVTAAEEALECHLAELSFLKQQLAELSEEVEVTA